MASVRAVQPAPTEAHGVGRRDVLHLGKVVVAFAEELPRIPAPFGINAEAEAKGIGIALGEREAGIEVEQPTRGGRTGGQRDGGFLTSEERDGSAEDGGQAAE